MTDHKQHCYKITTWFHLRPRRKAKPHLAMKEYRRGTSLPEHDETGEAGCLIKIEHRALGFLPRGSFASETDLRALRKVRRPGRPSCIVRPRKPKIWQNQELILTAFRRCKGLGTMRQFTCAPRALACMSKIAQFFSSRWTDTAGESEATLPMSPRGTLVLRLDTVEPILETSEHRSA
jgi:hypothetical protein